MQIRCDWLDNLHVFGCVRLWKLLERAQQLDIKYVLPGHGPVAGKDLLEKQKHYFAELRRQVGKGIEAGKSLGDIFRDIGNLYLLYIVQTPARLLCLFFCFKD